MHTHAHTHVHTFISCLLRKRYQLGIMIKMIVIVYYAQYKAFVQLQRLMNQIIVTACGQLFINVRHWRASRVCLSFESREASQRALTHTHAGI